MTIQKQTKTSTTKQNHVKKNIKERVFTKQQQVIVSNYDTLLTKISIFTTKFCESLNRALKPTEQISLSTARKMEFFQKRVKKAIPKFLKQIVSVILNIKDKTLQENFLIPHTECYSAGQLMMFKLLYFVKNTKDLANAFMCEMYAGKYLIDMTHSYPFVKKQMLNLNSLRNFTSELYELIDLYENNKEFIDSL